MAFNLAELSIELTDQSPTYQISTKLHQAFPRNKLSKIGLVSSFLVFVKVWKLP